MTTFDPTQLNALVADLVTKEDALASASDANTTAQAAAQAAVASAASTAAAQQTAHQAVSDAVDALEAYATSLKA